jgi:hypothetical protein
MKKTIEFDPTPAELGEAFALMDSNKQVEFFAEVGRQFDKFEPRGGAYMQVLAIVDDLVTDVDACAWLSDLIEAIDAKKVREVLEDAAATRNART